MHSSIIVLEELLQGFPGYRGQGDEGPILAKSAIGGKRVVVGVAISIGEGPHV